MTNLLHKTWSDRALMLAGARAKYGRGSDEEQRLILAFRDEMKRGLRLATLAQRDWQSKVAKRPLKAHYYDSWHMREMYLAGRSEYSPRHHKAKQYAAALAAAAGREPRWHNPKCADNFSR